MAKSVGVLMPILCILVLATVAKARPDPYQRIKIMQTPAGEIQILSCLDCFEGVVLLHTTVLVSCRSCV